jgi:rhodanese-related sulfurtransferase
MARSVSRAAGALLLWQLLSPAPAGAGDFLSPGLSPDDLLAMPEPEAPLVVDLRAPAEFRIAHLPGAVNIPLAELEDRIDELRGERGVLVYCLNGTRTRKAEPVLYTHGMDDVYHLEGALEGWIRDGHPIEKGGPERARW